MTPKFLPVTTAHEEAEALAAMIPGAAFWTGLSADLIAVERQREGGVLVVQVPAVVGGDVLHDRRQRVVDSDALPLLLTPSAAVRVLGIDRRSTLACLIADDAIDVVSGAGGRLRIPRSEVLRLGVEGIPPPGNRRRPPRKQNPPAAPALRRRHGQRDHGHQDRLGRSGSTETRATKRPPYCASGKSMVNTQPLPGKSRTRTDPPDCSTARRLIASPSPSPERSVARWENG